MRKRQYYGHFTRNQHTEHVLVTTNTAGKIVAIHVMSAPFRTSFQLSTYDRTNKLQVNALILVNDVLLKQSTEDMLTKKWYATIEQDWPTEARLLPADWPEH